MRARIGDIRILVAGLIVATAVALAAVTVIAVDDGLEQHAVIGRFVIESEAGGAVWAFQSSGVLIITGPGDLMAEGRWTGAPGSGTGFDATVDVTVTSQQLNVLGEVSPSGREVAVYVAASPPDDQQNAVPWPPESRLVGQSLGLVGEPTPAPSIDPVECLRPSWSSSSSVDWAPCASSEVSQDTMSPVAPSSPVTTDPSAGPSPLP